MKAKNSPPGAGGCRAGGKKLWRPDSTDFQARWQPSDLVEFAKHHRLRIANIHAPYRAQADRFDVIRGHRGWVSSEAGRLGFYIELRSGHGKAKVLRALVGAGVTVTQEGDFEIAGDAPVTLLSALLKAVRVRRRHPGRNTPPWNSSRAQECDGRGEAAT